MIFLFLDELQLSNELAEASNNAFARPSKDVSKGAMYFGILTNRILPGTTVLGFSRSGKFIEKEFLNIKFEAYTLLDVELEDIQGINENHAKDPNQMKLIFSQLKQIGLNQILFLMKILKHQEDYFQKITTATDLFLIVLRDNLAFHDQKNHTGFAQLLKDKESDLKNIFKLCKENLQLNRTKDDDEGLAGVINGSTFDGNWISEASRIKVSLNVLTSVGIFDIPPTSCDTLTLTATHLSFVEFFASVGIILSSDIKAELEKIKNPYRILAVSIYIRNDLLHSFKKSYCQFFYL